MKEFKAAVVDEQDMMVVVRFYAPWCRACKAATPAYNRLTSGYEQNYPGKVKFVDCPVTEDNKHLHKGLGIKTIPFAHIYHPEAGLVEQRKIGRKNFLEFERVLGSYREASCDVAADGCSSARP